MISLYDYFIPFASGMPPTLPNGAESQSSQKSDRFWLDDGSALVSLVPSVYKIHKSILDRHTTKSASWLLDATDPAVLALSKAIDDVGTPIIVVPVELGITIEDF